MKYYTYDKPVHQCPVGCCPGPDCNNEGFPIMFDATCHGIGSSRVMAQAECDRLNERGNLRVNDDLFEAIDSFTRERWKELSPEVQVLVKELFNALMEEKFS